ARRDAIQACPPPSLGDQRRQILHLALNRVGRGVAALATTAPVVGVYREVIGQQRCQRRIGPHRPRAQGAVYQNQRRPASYAAEGNDRAIGGLDRARFHQAPSRCSARCCATLSRLCVQPASMPSSAAIASGVTCVTTALMTSRVPPPSSVKVTVL